MARGQAWSAARWGARCGAREEGGVALYVLGVALMFLLLVAGFGLADLVRASVVRQAGERALAAATQSAVRVSRSDAGRVQRTFREVLSQNLGQVPFQAEVRWVGRGAIDPLTGHRSDREALSSRLVLEFRPAYLGKWLPKTQVQLFHSEPVPSRKPGS